MTGPRPAPRGDDVEIVTFGCRLNAFESEVMRGAAAAAGLADAVIVNTCAVTAEAERQARQAIRRARRRRPGARIVVAGCAAQLAPQSFAAMPEVDSVLGNREKLDPASLAPSAPGLRVDDIMVPREGTVHPISGFRGRARAFVEIQNGCDHRCTFCIIPFARGNNRSVTADAVIGQVRTLVAEGCREIVLTGVDIASYGADLPAGPRLGGLVRRILRQIPELPRLRLSTLDPAAFDEELFDTFAGEPRLMPHAHLSLQAGSDLILKRMKRRHGRGAARALCRRLGTLRPDIVLGADLIAGFPTEEEADFAETLAHVEECGITFLHVFPYSPRRGTPAARMPQVPPAVRRARAGRLRALGAGRLAHHLTAQVGSATSVLVEGPGSGRTPGYARLSFAPLRDGARAGEIVRMDVTGATDTMLVGAPTA